DKAKLEEIKQQQEAERKRGEKETALKEEQLRKQQEKLEQDKTAEQKKRAEEKKIPQIQKEQPAAEKPKAEQQQPATEQQQPIAEQAQAEQVTPPAWETYEVEYRVKPLDTLTIKIYGEEELSGDYKVQKGGFIDMPLIRKVEVGGMTVYEIEDKIVSLLEKDYLVNPQVMINVKEYHSEKIVVLGQVVKPGNYELSSEEPITLLRAISMAGGFTNVAATNSVKIIRIEKGNKTTITVDTREIIDGKKNDIMLQPGDLIMVPESFW
ncbi:MAG: polysaccharide biosynthesis/export family protein, partial [Candidatus Omnitrophica bacterium]|nr:polysaccharide biosynthesis/export family protein [Candidatus Omnitrophota bacterium]